MLAASAVRAFANALMRLRVCCAFSAAVRRFLVNAAFYPADNGLESDTEQAYHLK